MAGEGVRSHGRWRRALKRKAPLPLQVAADLVRDADHRHRGSSVLAALAGRRRLKRLQRRAGPKQLVVIALVEHVGDLIAAEPIVRHVRHAHPDAHLVFVVRDRYRALIEHHPAIDSVITVRCLTQWLHMRSSSAIDRLYDLHVAGRLCERCNVPAPPLRDDPDININIDNYYHHGNLLTIYCRCAGLPILDETPELHIAADAAAAVDALGLPGAYVVMHGRSNQPERDWHDAGWRELVERLSAAGVAVVEVGLEPVVGGAGTGYRDLCGRLSLMQTAEVIRRASLLVAIDSGPAHMGNAVGTPAVVLLGHYGPYRRYLPYSGGYADGANAELLYADGPAATLSVERVHDAVQRRRAAPRRATSATGAHA